MPRGPIPKHACIDGGRIEVRTMYGHTGPCAPVTCPICKEERWYAVRTLRQLLAEHRNFLGVCRRCYRQHPEARHFRSRAGIRHRKNPGRRLVNAIGYVTLSRNAISDEDMPKFNVMRGKGGFVFEHRWVMAKHLGRVLTSNELVDHMNGNKADNQLDNLRMYVRGKQQPGSAPGHGTYYHEWQMAERRVRELESEMQALRSCSV